MEIIIAVPKKNLGYACLHNATVEILMFSAWLCNIARERQLMWSIKSMKSMKSTESMRTREMRETRGMTEANKLMYVNYSMKTVETNTIDTNQLSYDYSKVLYYVKG